MKSVLLLSFVLLLSWTPTQQEGASALMAADRAFAEDTAADGLEGWLRWFAPDATIATRTGELRTGSAELREYYASIGFPPARFSWEPASGALSEAGDLGYTVGSWTIRAPDAPAQPGAVLAEGRYLSVWRRQADGAFRVVADMGGREDVRTRFEEAEGPPLEWSSTSERFEQAESGELAFTLASWTARMEAAEHRGLMLTVWRRSGEKAWEIAAEIGSE